MDPNEFWVHDNFESGINLCLKNVGTQKSLGPKCLLEKCWVKKKFWLGNNLESKKKCRSEKMLCQKNNFGEKIGSKMLSQKSSSFEKNV